MSSRSPRTLALTLASTLALATFLLGACSFDGKGPGVLASGGIDLGPAVDRGGEPDTQEPCRDAGCPFGCHPVENRCLRLLPSNFAPQPVYDGATAELVLDSSEEVLISTSHGTIEVDGSPLDQNMRLISQLTSGAPPTRLLAVESLRITARTVVKVTGDYPLIIYARDTITVEGTVDASADGAVPGPGGRRGGVGDTNLDLDHATACGWGGRTGGEGGGGHREIEALISGLTTDGGGGGGGWGSIGAPGGTGGPCAPVGPATAGRGGDAIAGEASYVLTPLAGGCGGGAGGGPDEFILSGVAPGPGNIGGDGGSGGGGLQLSAGTRIVVAANAIINVGGGGGEPGGDLAGGGGGGSGGSLLLESATIEVGGILAANGGGGGAGGLASLEDAIAPGGEDGTTSNAPAEGGTIGQVYGPIFGAPGGDGAALASAAEGGGGGHEGLCNAGGGGGGVGRIVLISAQTVPNVPASPAAATHYTIQTW